MSKFSKSMRKTLEVRTARLLRLLDIDAPEYMLAKEVAMVLSTGAALWPDVVGEAIMLNLRDRACMARKFCTLCQEPRGDDPQFCDKCIDEMQTEDEEDDGEVN